MGIYSERRKCRWAHSTDSTMNEESLEMIRKIMVMFLSASLSLCCFCCGSKRDHILVHAQTWETSVCGSKHLSLRYLQCSGGGLEAGGQSRLFHVLLLGSYGLDPSWNTRHVWAKCPLISLWISDHDVEVSVSGCVCGCVCPSLSSLLAGDCSQSQSSVCAPYVCTSLRGGIQIPVYRPHLFLDL